MRGPSIVHVGPRVPAGCRIIAQIFCEILGESVRVQRMIKINISISDTQLSWVAMSTVLRRQELDSSKPPRCMTSR
jgi:hypothetical protein